MVCIRTTLTHKQNDNASQQCAYIMISFIAVKISREFGAPFLFLLNRYCFVCEHRLTSACRGVLASPAALGLMMGTPSNVSAKQCEYYCRDEDTRPRNIHH